MATKSKPTLKPKLVVIQRITLPKTLAPFHAQFRAATRRPVGKGRMPKWFPTLTPELQALVKAQAFAVVADKMPDPTAISQAVMDYWSR